MQFDGLFALASLFGALFIGISFAPIAPDSAPYVARVVTVLLRVLALLSVSGGLAATVGMILADKVLPGLNDPLWAFFGGAIVCTVLSSFIGSFPWTSRAKAREQR